MDLRTASRILSLISLLCFAVAGSTGCEATPQAAASLHLAVNAYDSRDYAQAQELAESALGGAQGEPRYEAAYVAGISAYQLRNLRTAETHLELAKLSSNPETSGKASAMLGIIKMSRSQPAGAARDFEIASNQLSGYDATRAADHAARATQQASGVAVHTSSTSLRPISSRNAALFSLQAGAFLDRSKAERAAESTRTFARQIRAGDVRIVPSTDGADRLYLVQFGYYPSRQSAAQARGGNLSYLVVPTAQ